MRAEAAFRYEELAGYIRALVDSGMLCPGARIPSLRETARQRRASVSTVLHAYRLLEDRGVIEARPRSSYVVVKSAPIGLNTPSPSRPPQEPVNVAVSRVVQQLLDHASDPTLVPLGCAIPSAELLAAGRLDRFLARAARTKGSQYNTYSVQRGELHLRQEIARRALRWGQVLAPENIAITCGCTEALSLVLGAVARRGDTIAVESPTYFGMLQAIEALDLKVLELPTDAKTGIDLPALERALAGGRVKACLLSSSFNNPLGCTMDRDKKIAVLEMLARHAVPLIEDDIYGDIHFAKERPVPFMALDRHDNTIYCGSFSKTIAPGYRIGWVVSERHMPALLERKFVTTLCGPLLPQVALADFLSSGGYDSHLRRIRRTFENNLHQMVRVIDEVFPRGTRVTQPAGGFVLWLVLPKTVSARALFSRALERGVCFAPGDVFSASGGYGNCLRLSCGHDWDHRIEAGLRILGALVHDAV